MLERGVWYLFDAFAISVLIRLFDPVLDYAEHVLHLIIP